MIEALRSQGTTDVFSKKYLRQLDASNRLKDDNRVLVKKNMYVVTNLLIDPIGRAEMRIFGWFKASSILGSLDNGRMRGRMLKQDRREHDDTSLTSDGNYCYYRAFSFNSENGLQWPQCLTKNDDSASWETSNLHEVRGSRGAWTQTTQHQLQSYTHNTHSNTTKNPWHKSSVTLWMKTNLSSSNCYINLWLI